MLKKDLIKHQEMYLRVCYILENIDYANLHTAERLAKEVEHYYDDMVMWLNKLERIYFSSGFMRHTDGLGRVRSK